MARRLLGLLILGAACLDNNPKFVETDPSTASATTGAPGETTDDPTPSSATVTTEQSTSDPTTGPLPTTTPPVTCPDGQLDPDEQCDDGNLEDLDGCSNDCHVAVCGDGVAQLMEECDDGNLEDLDDCSNSCVAGECGDNVKQMYEECDDGNAVDFDGCQTDCFVSPKLVFVTSELYTGAMGGLAGADAQCKLLAGDAGIPGEFVAWLSTGLVTAKDRIEPAQVPYALRSGALVAIDWQDLLDGELLQPIDETETGGKPPPATTLGCGVNAVYTNTTPDGDVVQPQLDCLMWTSTRGIAGFGDSKVAMEGWTDNCTDSCPTSAPIYCVQQ